MHEPNKREGSCHVVKGNKRDPTGERKIENIASLHRQELLIFHYNKMPLDLYWLVADTLTFDPKVVGSNPNPSARIRNYVF